MDFKKISRKAGSLSFNTETGEPESSQTLWDEATFNRLGRNRGRMMDRSNSFIGGGNTNENKETAVVVVDPFSTGAHVAAEICRLGYKCIKVLSTWDSPVAALVQQGMVINYLVTIQHNSNLLEQDIAIDEVITKKNEIIIKCFFNFFTFKI
jgi:hypothetical protein